MKTFLHITIALFVVAFACKKPQPPKAIIKTLDTLYKPVSNVTVRVYAKPNGSYIDPENKIIELKDKTNENGEVQFEFKNEAIFNVEAKQTNPNRQASGMIFLQENKTTEKTLILR